MSEKLKIFPDKGYKEILKEVGPFRYAIYEKDEIVPGDVFNRTLSIENYNCVVAGTGSTVSLCALNLSSGRQVVIPQNSPVVVVRLLRQDQDRGTVHYNADDQIIFPTTEGNIFRLARKDAPDHYLELAAASNILTVADAYRLPTKKSGPIEKYNERGAQLHVDLFPREVKPGE